MSSNYLRAACAAALSLIVSLPAVAGTLGVAGDFNGFVFGNLTSHGQDTEGRLAVGGNLTASSYGVGAGGVGPAVPITNPRTDVLVVGGNMNAQGGWQVFNGNAVWGTSLTAAPTTFNGVTKQGMPVDFAAAQTDLLAKSAYWGSLAPNAPAVYDGYSTLTLTATNPGLNVFNVTESDWENTSSKLIVNPNPNATLLINILATNVSQMYGMSYNGSGSPSSAHSNVLFNYPNATTLDITSMAVLGSVLAPKAALTITGGGINGNGIVASALQQGGGEFHNFAFTGNLPDPPTIVPEPASIGLMLIGLVAFFGGRRR